MVLFPGEYAGILEPWKHYIPLAKDFSNFAEVAAKIKDDDYLQAVVDRNYNDLIASGKYSYQTLSRSSTRSWRCTARGMNRRRSSSTARWREDEKPPVPSGVSTSASS